ncbi:MAG: hypothetical protein ACXABY_12930 [Candidatus Thorarchaeota archaeon]|jgi:hypothetical protein
MTDAAWKQATTPQIQRIPVTWDIADGSVTGFDFIDKFGVNGTVGTAYEEVWSLATAYPWQASAEVVKISSNSVEDDIDKGGSVAGTGAHTIEIFGLDADYEPISETITMNGTADVASSKSYLRINRMKVVTCGTGRVNAGIIKAENNVSDTIWAQIDASVGQTLMALWTVPANKQLHITHWWAGESGAQATDIGLFIRAIGSDTSWQNKRIIRLVSSTFSHVLDYPVIVTAGSDVAIRAQATGGSSVVTGGFNGFYHAA